MMNTDQPPAANPLDNSAPRERIQAAMPADQFRHYKLSLTLVALVMAYFLATACADTRDHSHLYDLSSNLGWSPQVTPDDLDNYIQWPDAVDLLMSGQVEQTMQTHALSLYLILEDGEIYSTIQPDIDTYLIILRHCGSPCADIIEITE